MSVSPLAPMVAFQVSPSPQKACAHLLVIDDNELNRIVIAEMLHEIGVACTLAEGARQAFDHLGDGQSYDAILVDMRMPDQDGLAFLQDYQARVASMGLARAPVLAWSANSQVQPVEAYLAAGFDGHLPKPLRFNDLLAFVETISQPRH